MKHFDRFSVFVVEVSDSQLLSYFDRKSNWRNQHLPVLFISNNSSISSESSIPKHLISINHKINNHNEYLTGLATSTTYYFVVGSANLGGQLSTSSVMSFTTPAI